MDMKDQRFGIEVEMTGLTRQQAAQVAAEHFGSSVHFDGTYYGIYSTLDSEGRQWKFMSDGSIDTQKKSGRQIVSADSDYIVLALNDQTQVTIKRDFVSAVLPKGSIQSL